MVNSVLCSPLPRGLRGLYYTQGQATGKDSYEEELQRPGNWEKHRGTHARVLFEGATDRATRISRPTATLITAWDPQPEASDERLRPLITR